MKIFLSTLVFIGVFLVSSLLIQKTSNVIGQIFFLLFFGGIQIVLYKKYFPVFYRNFFLYHTVKWYFVLISISIPLISVIIFLFVSNYFYDITAIDFDTSNLVGILIGQTYIGIVEEVFFRAVILLVIFEMSKLTIFSCIVSSFVFAIFHSLSVSFLASPFAIIFFIIIGISFAILFLLTKSIWVVIILHAFFNILWKIVDIETEIPILNFYEFNLAIPTIIPFFLLAMVIFFTQRNRIYILQ